MPGGGGPFGPVSVTIVPSSGVIIQVEEGHRSSPALPAVALERGSRRGPVPSDGLVGFALVDKIVVYKGPGPGHPARFPEPEQRTRANGQPITLVLDLHSLAQCLPRLQRGQGPGGPTYFPLLAVSQAVAAEWAIL